jgi:hypothetical protein
MDDRRDNLERMLSNLEEVHSEWAGDESPGLPVEGVFWNAMDETIDCFFREEEGIPGGMMGLYRTVEKLSTQWKSYKVSAYATSDPTMTPGPAFWRQFEIMFNVRDQCQPQGPRLLESIEQFDKQGVNDRQIAIAYDWYLPDGSPDMERVRQKRDSGDNSRVVSAEHERRTRVIAEKAAERVKAVKKSKTKKTKKAKKLESLEELVKQGVSLKQISGMLHKTQKAILDECKEKGLEIVASETVYQSRAPSEPQLDETEERRLDAVSTMNDHDQYFEEGVEAEEEIELEGATIEHQILNLSDRGLVNTDIAKRLEISRQRVQSVVKRRAEIEELA